MIAVNELLSPSNALFVKRGVLVFQVYIIILQRRRRHRLGIQSNITHVDAAMRAQRSVCALGTIEIRYTYCN